MTFCLPSFGFIALLLCVVLFCGEILCFVYFLGWAPEAAIGRVSSCPSGNPCELSQKPPALLTRQPPPGTESPGGDKAGYGPREAHDALAEQVGEEENAQPGHHLLTGNGSKSRLDVQDLVSLERILQSDVSCAQPKSLPNYYRGEAATSRAAYRDSKPKTEH